MLTPAHAEGRRDLEADGPRRPKPVAEVGAYVTDEPVERLDAGDRAGEERGRPECTISVAAPEHIECAENLCASSGV